SACRYPSLTVDKKTLIRDQTKNTIKQVYDIDILDVYFQTLLTSLSTYYSQKDINYNDKLSEYIWILLRTIRYIIMTKMVNEKISTEHQLNETIGQLHELIRNRDKSINDAAKYKKFISKLHPSDYYYCLYNLMILYPEDVHKSNLMQMDTILL
ncbi:unnamed protein product, partial [Didymodactylos carnosus]